ncbi:hypothetical protein [Kiloniella sp.]|uniref:hypothetical protein n=1 Tax=Kiloniella sp. TaxID=1938587 RepID=UPI003B01A0F6
MTDAISNAIEQANESAAQAPTTPASSPAPQNLPANQSVNDLAPAPASGVPLGMDDFMTGGISVDHWIKPSEFGIALAKGKLTETLLVKINLAEVQYCEAIKYGNPATYHKTYDRITTADGITWHQAIANAKAVDGDKARPYASADIPMVLDQEVDVEHMEAGQLLGYSLSTTNRNNWQSFIRSITNAGLDPKGSFVKVELGNEVRNKGQNTWGLLTFKLIEEVDQAAA